MKQRRKEGQGGEKEGREAEGRSWMLACVCVCADTAHLGLCMHTCNIYAGAQKTVQTFKQRRSKKLTQVSRSFSEDPSKKEQDESSPQQNTVSFKRQLTAAHATPVAFMNVIFTFIVKCSLPQSCNVDQKDR